MEPTNIAAKQVRWRFSGDNHGERGTLIEAGSDSLRVRRWHDDVVLDMAWEGVEWVKSADRELWCMEFSSREKTYLTKRGATYGTNTNVDDMHFCDIYLPEGTTVKPNRDANEFRDFIAALPTGEKIMFFKDPDQIGRITGIINRKGELVMGHYPHDDAPCAHY
jgi:hypothetical protein